MKPVRLHVIRTSRFLVIFLAALPLAGRPQTMLSHPDVATAKTVAVAKDEFKLIAVAPKDWKSGGELPNMLTGTPLPSLLTGTTASGVRRVTEPGAFDPRSLVLKHGATILVVNRDYVLDPKWAVLWIAPHSSLAASDIVTASYRYSLLRLDSLVRRPDGREYVQQGTSDITVPRPPELGPGEQRVANIFVPYFSDGKSGTTLLFPILETASQAETLTTSGRIPRTLKKLRSGQPVRIVCWGDSITSGGDADLPRNRYPAILERALRKRFPKAKLSVEAVAAPASTSRMWLSPEQFPYEYGKQFGGPDLSWRQVVASNPDLITIEFLNDAHIDAPETLPAIYTDILQRIKEAGSEVILITPSFTSLADMHWNSYAQQDTRPYTQLLRSLAAEDHLALADAAARWGHLVKEGIPHTTYLRNGFNHPDNRGHQIFVDELLKNFK